MTYEKIPPGLPIEAQLCKALEALSFYADKDNYFAISFIADPPSGAFADDFEYIPMFGRADTEYMDYKPGKLAETLRELLKDPRVLRALHRYGADDVVQDQENSDG